MPCNKAASNFISIRACDVAAVERPIAPEIHDCCGHLKLASGIEVRANDLTQPMPAVWSPAAPDLLNASCKSLLPHINIVSCPFACTCWSICCRMVCGRLAQVLWSAAAAVCRDTLMQQVEMLAGRASKKLCPADILRGSESCNVFFSTAYLPCMQHFCMFS